MPTTHPCSRLYWVMLPVADLSLSLCCTIHTIIQMANTILWYIIPCLFHLLVQCNKSCSWVKCSRYNQFSLIYNPFPMLNLMTIFIFVIQQRIWCINIGWKGKCWFSISQMILSQYYWRCVQQCFGINRSLGSGTYTHSSIASEWFSVIIVDIPETTAVLICAMDDI